MAASLPGRIKILLFFDNLSLAAPTEVLALSRDQAGSLSTSTPSPGQSCDLGGWMSTDLSHRPAGVIVSPWRKASWVPSKGSREGPGPCVWTHSHFHAPGWVPGAVSLCPVCISVYREPCGLTLPCSQCSHSSRRLFSCERWDFRKLPMCNVVRKLNEKVLSTGAVVWMPGNTPLPAPRLHLK